MTEPAGALTVTFLDQRVVVGADNADGVVFGRAAELDIDTNPFLHRRVGRFVAAHGAWWLHNLGSSALSTHGGGEQVIVGPGRHAALVDECTIVRFSAGNCVYEVVAEIDGPLPLPDIRPEQTTIDATLRPTEIPLTDEQRLLVLALAEHRLRTGQPDRALPSNDEIAAALGWSRSKYNRKLDWLCQRLDRTGVAGLRATGRRTNERRGNLVDFALATRLVTHNDLPDLDRHRRAIHQRSDAR